MIIYILGIDDAMDFVSLARKLGFDVSRAKQVTRDGWFELRVPMDENYAALLADSLRIPIKNIKTADGNPLTHRFISEQ